MLWVIQLQRRFALTFWGALSVLLLILMIPGAALCDEFRIIPSIALREAYNDNIYFSTSDRVQSWTTTITPGLELTDRTEKMDLGLSAIVGINRYTDEPSLNSIDQHYKGRLGYTFDPTVNMQAETGWSRTSSPDRDIATTGIVLGNIQRDKTYGNIAGNWAISPRLAAGAFYSYEQDLYDSPTVSNLEWNQANVGLYYDLGLATKARLIAGYAGYRFTSQDTNSFSGTVGVDYRYHELWTIVVDAGARYASTKYQVQELQFVPPFFLVPVKVDKTSEEWSGICTASIKYNGEKTISSLSFSYDLAPASGLSGAAQRTAFIFDIRHRLTYEFSGAFSTSYFLNYAAANQYGVNAINQETFTVVPSLRYEFTRDLYLDLGYNFSNTQYKLTSTSAYRDLAFVRLYAQHRLFE